MAIIPIMVITKNINVIDKESDNLVDTNIVVGPSASRIFIELLPSYLYIKYIGNRYSQIPASRAIMALTTVTVSIILAITKFLCMLILIINSTLFPKFACTAYYIIYFTMEKYCFKIQTKYGIIMKKEGKV